MHFSLLELSKRSFPAIIGHGRFVFWAWRCVGACLGWKAGWVKVEYPRTWKVKIRDPHYDNSNSMSLCLQKLDKSIPNWGHFSQTTQVSTQFTCFCQGVPPWMQHFNITITLHDFFLGMPLPISTRVMATLNQYDLRCCSMMQPVFCFNKKE